MLSVPAHLCQAKYMCCTAYAQFVPRCPSYTHSCAASPLCVKPGMGSCWPATLRRVGGSHSAAAAGSSQGCGDRRSFYQTVFACSDNSEVGTASESSCIQLYLNSFRNCGASPSRPGRVRPSLLLSTDGL